MSFYGDYFPKTDPGNFAYTYVDSPLDRNVLRKLKSASWQFTQFADLIQLPLVDSLYELHDTSISTIHTHTHTHIFTRIQSIFNNRRSTLAKTVLSRRWWGWEWREGEERNQLD